MKPSFLSRFLLVLAALVFAPLALHAQTITGATGQVGVNYSYQVTSSATPPVIYGATGLPTGLAINASSGLITGVPTAAGTVTGSVSVTSGGLTNSAPISITINPGTGTPAISSGTNASGTVGAAFGPYTVTASNGPTSFNIGTLPAGLTVVGPLTAPTITGTPTTATVPGTPFQVSLSANNGSGTGATTILNLTIASATGTPVISSSTSPASVAVGAALSYQITASNSPNSYNASGLPAGVSLSASGLISGNPTVAGVYPVSVSAANGTGTGVTVTVTFTVGGVPAINSTLAANGNVSAAFNYNFSATPAATSFNIGPLPAGLTANTTTGAISGIPTATGVTSVSVSANNATGTGASATLVITISPAVVPPGGGGGGGGGGGTVIPPTTVAAPTISAPPTSQSVTEGSSVTFSFSAVGTGLNFQWSKNGTPITGALGATLTLTSVTAADAGVYAVFVSNLGGSVVSSGATLTVTPKPIELPVIATQPIARTTTIGGSATFTVVATGTGPLSYQWQKDGVAIAGATNATLNLTNANAATAGAYRVVVTNSGGSTTSSAAALTVSVRAIVGTYVGAFGSNGGTFALIVRDDRTGVFLGYASATRLLLLSRDVIVDASGRFSVAVPDPRPAVTTAATATTPATAAHEGDFHVDGTVAADGTLAGTVSGLNLTFSAPVAAAAGSTAAYAGFYQAGAVSGSAQSYAIVSPAGQAVVVNVTGIAADGGSGTVAANGALAVTTAANATVVGAVAADTATISTTVTSAGIATVFAGANDVRTDTEKLINISTRSQTGTAANTLIAGFVISGDAAKPVLVRAIGPTLGTAFNVGGALSAARLEIFRGQTSIAVGNDWGTPAAGGASAATLAATAARVGAFALPAASRDASLLLTLEPGAYTAVVTGQNNANGVSLVEVYDATDGAIPRARRIINIATRATAGTGDNALIAGFYVSGTVPKRLLIRGVGPGLAQFGVGGVLARPQLTVNSGVTTIAQNAGWTTSPDSAQIASSAAQVGAFAFAAGSQDAALIINLAPGAYTAQVSGVANTTGVALVEVYELP